MTPDFRLLTVEGHISSRETGLFFPCIEEVPVSFTDALFPIQPQPFRGAPDSKVIRPFDFEIVTDGCVVQEETCVFKPVNAAIFFIDEDDLIPQPFQDQTGILKIGNHCFDLFPVSDPFVVLMFGFVGVVHDGHLNFCVLAKRFQTSAAAVRFREKLKRKMDVKFGNIEYKGEEDGFKYYLGGVNPFDESQYGFRIAVEKEPDGTYSAGIWYGPYGITPENLGFGD